MRKDVVVKSKEKEKKKTQGKTQGVRGRIKRVEPGKHRHLQKEEWTATWTYTRALILSSSLSHPLSHS